MALFTLSPNMSLTIPSVGIDPGPDWANNINNSLTVLDGHSHSLGSGVQITPSGLNLNADVSLLSNNLTVVRSLRFSSQGSPLALGTDLGCLYESGVDLYFNSGSGQQIRLTSLGAVAGTPGSISGLVAPASASYVPANSTFVWQSNVNTAANLDAGSLIIREVAASAKGITLSSPVSLAANYVLTLPPGLPSLKTALSSDASGNLTFTSGLQSFDAVVGSAAQVTAGVATHSTLTAAIAAVSTNQTIKVLQGAWTENLSLGKQIIIEGSGYNSVFTGTFTFASCTYAVVQGIRFTGNLTIDSASSGNTMTGCYTAGSGTDNSLAGTGNYIELIQG